MQARDHYKLPLKIRGDDIYGSGEYKASRGSRLHNGADLPCDPGELVSAASGGNVTKIGYPYSQGPDADPDKAALRYVQVTDKYGIDVRYFYVLPSVKVGDWVMERTVLGTAQGLNHIYPGITEHFHFETLVMVNGKKVFSDPEQYLYAVR